MSYRQFTDLRPHEITADPVVSPNKVPSTCSRKEIYYLKYNEAGLSRPIFQVNLSGFFELRENSNLQSEINFNLMIPFITNPLDSSCFLYESIVIQIYSSLVISATANYMALLSAKMFMNHRIRCTVGFVEACR